MDYIVCESETIEALQRRVNEYLRLNYTAIGGVAIARERVTGPLKYCQAVLKNGTGPGARGWHVSTVANVSRRGRPPTGR